ncbi:helix-turn-helix domain-containing protein [Fibrisoma limi]
MGHAKPTPEPADLIDIHVASVIIGKAVSTIYSMVNRNEIPYMKRGNRLYFSREELRNWIRDTRNRTVDECKEEVRSDLRNRSRV